MGVIEKDLYSFEYPEFKMDMCVTGWMHVPCPTWSNPGRMCREDIKTPCMKTKTSRFRVWVTVEYPDSIEEAVKERIQACHLTAAGVATGVIYTAATASSVVGPQATIAAAIAAISPAAEAYGKSFWACITALNLPDVIKNQIKANLHREDVGITDWREFNTWEIPNPYYINNPYHMMYQ